MQLIISLLGIFFVGIANSSHISASDLSMKVDGRFSENAVVYQLFEMFRSLMKFGDGDNNIPIMDPYTFNADGAQINKWLNIEMNITNGVISGLSNFQLADFSFMRDEMALNIVVKIPRIKFDAEYYEMEGEIFEALPISGSGILYFLIKDVTLSCKLYLKQSDDGKSVTIARIENNNYAIEKILSRTDYDKNIDDVLNAMIEDLLAGYLTRFSKYIAKTYENNVVFALNSIIDGYDTWSILAMILH